ncbi:MAG: PAS domain-containing protein [Cyanobacteria bacterium P01_A01_bin.45]
MSVQDIVESALKLISVYFPNYRVSYATIDPDNQLQVIHSIQPPKMSSKTGLQVDLTASEKYLQELRQSSSVIIEDVSTDNRIASLLDVISSDDMEAVIDIPVYHSEQLVGLLGFDSPVPYKWREHEITTIKEVANYLSVAIRESNAQQERILALKALQESKERFSLALKGTNDGIWDWNIQTNEVFFSHRWKQMLGYDQTEISNYIDEWIDRIHPHDVGGVMEVMQHHFSQDNPFYISEYRLQCKDGSYKWILDRGQALWDNNGNVIRMAGSHTDITERKLSEEKLRQSEERLRIVARATNDVVWDWDLSDDKRWWNENVSTLFGYSITHVRENTGWWYEHIHPKDKLRVVQDIHRAIDSGKQFWSNEYRFRRLDGTYAYILDRGHVVHDHANKPIRMIGAMMDISDRKRYQEELQRQNLRSQLFADVTVKIRESLQVEDILHTSVVEVQKLLYADRVLILRLRADNSVNVVQEAVVPGLVSVIGHNIVDPCFGKEYIEKYSQGRISAISDIEKANIRPCHVQFLKQFQVKANLVVPILLHDQLWGLLIAHQCSKPRNWTNWETELLRQLADQIGIALAQSKSLEQETRQRQELAASNEELQQFAFIASHDLQEPLRKIKAFGDRLHSTCNEALSEQGRDYLSRMQNASSRMQTLIDDLLILSRVTTRAQPLRPVNLTQIVEEVLSDLEIRIQQTQGMVRLNELPTIKADPLQMRQLLQNLIGNALKFHRQNHPPVVEISSQTVERDSTSYCELTIKDNGIGFDKKYTDRIFQVFQRLHGRSEYEGTGIGLAICRKIIERHCGEITAISQLGSGTSFIVRLPTDLSEEMR